MNNKIRTGMFALVSLLLACGAGGCGHSHDSHDDHDGHHHEESLQLTAYGQRYELFAEATPFVAGEDCDILAHVTQLSDFKPLQAGKVTMTLSVGGASQSVTLDAPARPGVYPFEITPKKTGNGELKFTIASDSGNETVVVAGIKVYADEHEAHHAAAEAAAKSSNGVAFPKEQSWNAEFSTEEVTYSPFGEVIRTMAQVEPSQGDEQVVAAKAAGIVHLATADLTEGKSVGAGQTLFSIDTEGMADNNLRVRSQEAEADYEFAKKEYERKKELAKEKLVTEGDLLRAKAEYERAEAAWGALRRNFGTGRYAASSPMAGFVKRVYAGNGEYVEAGAPVVAITKNRNLYVKAELPPRKFHSLGNITSATLRIPSENRTYSLGELDGSLVSYGKGVDTENPLVPVVFRINNTVDLLPGTFVEMYITAGNAPALTVPNTALVEEMGSFFVFVQLTPEFFEKREVTVGKSNGVRTEILSGLKDGERVVGKGAVLVKLSQASGKLDAHAGHVH